MIVLPKSQSFFSIDLGRALSLVDPQMGSMVLLRMEFSVLSPYSPEARAHAPPPSQLWLSRSPVQPLPPPKPPVPMESKACSHRLPPPILLLDFVLALPRCANLPELPNEEGLPPHQPPVFSPSSPTPKHLLSPENHRKCVSGESTTSRPRPTKQVEWTWPNKQVQRAWLTKPISEFCFKFGCLSSLCPRSGVRGSRQNFQQQSSCVQLQPPMLCPRVRGSRLFVRQQSSSDQLQHLLMVFQTRSQGVLKSVHFSTM